MKNLFTKIMIIFLSLTLVSCSTNTTKENTIIGAGTGAVAGGLLGSLASGAGSGWVIAAGAVVGAVVGGMIGNSMDSSDKTNTYTALNKNSVNQSSDWKNTSSKTVYRVVPTSKMYTINGNPNCRNYNTYSITSSGKKTMVKGTACRQTDGTWLAVQSH